MNRRMVDVSGLPDEAIRAVESLIFVLRSRPGNPREQYASHEEWSKALRGWAASHKPGNTEADWTRESIYAGRGE